MQWLSSNYSLYAIMSERMMCCIQEHCPNIEIYSIDEAFVELAGMPEHDVVEFAKKIRRTVTQWTGIPVCVGIGPTKTLAKMANALAKKKNELSVFSFAGIQKCHDIFKTFLVRDVWGIGRKTTATLNDLEIVTVHAIFLNKQPVRAN